MENKICVYAICKNEEKFVDTWLKSMSEADYIVVLDTGSTDGTFEKLKNDERVYKVEQKIYKKFRFDVARNDSMALCPEDANILVCTDLDEIFTDGWGDIVRKNWQEEDTRGFYRYAWSHNAVGEPTDIFWYDKMHNRNYEWIFPVHEVLEVKDGIDYQNEVRFEPIMLHHYQDRTKARSNYLDLLKLSVKENPESPHVQYLYAREHLVQNLGADEALKQFKKVLTMEYIDDPIFRMVKLDTLKYLARIYTDNGDYPNAMMYWYEFLKNDKTYREPYFAIAELYNHYGMYQAAKGMVLDGIKLSERKYDWVETKDSWINKAEDILSISDFYLGNIDDALTEVQEALKHDPDNVRMLKNYNYFLQTKVSEKE